MTKTTTPIINQIEEAVKDVPGWAPIDQLYTLFNMAYLTAGVEGDIIEIGAWCGRSTVILGMAARLVGNTKVHSIDLFPGKNDWKQNKDGTHSFEVSIGNKTYVAYNDQTVWKEPFERDIAPIYEKYDTTLDVFKETIAKNKLQDLVEVYKGDSDLLASSVGKDFKCKMVFVDGDHSYMAVCNDIKNTEKYLVKGGWICFDDAFSSSYEGVDKAITDLIIKNPDYERCQQMTRKFFIARKK